MPNSNSSKKPTIIECGFAIAFLIVLCFYLPSIGLPQLFPNQDVSKPIIIIGSFMSLCTFALGAYLYFRLVKRDDKKTDSALTINSSPKPNSDVDNNKREFKYHSMSRKQTYQVLLVLVIIFVVSLITP